MADYGVAGIVLCWLCEVPLLIDGPDAFTVDRFLPGIEGGTYVFTNCRPACLPCNLERGGRLGAERRGSGE